MYYIKIVTVRFIYIFFETDGAIYMILQIKLVGNIYFGLKKPKTRERHNLFWIQKKNYKHASRYQFPYRTKFNFVLI